MRLCFFISISFLAAIAAQDANAQCDATAENAHQYLSEAFVPDGQSYRALVYDDQVAEFYTTFFANSDYRIAGFAGAEEGQLIFSLYDEEDNLLFSNEKHRNAPYWNFSFESTINARIEARLDKTKQSSGCAVLVIGFER